MEKQTSKWLVNCGVGCGLLIVLLVVAGISIGLYVKNSFKSIAEAADSHQELVREYGQVEEFVPSVDGSVAPGRVEVFLSVREAMAEDRREIERLIADFPPDEVLEGEPSVRAVLSVFGDLVGLINPIAGFVDKRNQELLDREMSLGEYVYIYSTAYYSWLGHSPEDGPVISKAGTASDQGDRIFDGEDSTFGRKKVRRRYRRYMLAQVRNQAEGALEKHEVSLPADWRTRLEREIKAVESHPLRVFWQDGLPPEIAESFKPYRSRLQASYHTTTNCFEIPIHDSESWSR